MQPPGQGTPPGGPGSPFAPPPGQPPQYGYGQQPAQQNHPYGQAPQPLGAPPAQAPRPFGAPVAPGQVPVAFVPPPSTKTDHLKPRLGGLGIVGVGVLLLAINGYTLWSSDEYYPKLLVFSPIMLFAGAWLTVVGIPIDPQTGEPAVWSRVGAGISAALGLLVGIVAIWFVGC